MGDQADAGILYGPRGMLARDFPPCRGVSCAAPADGVPRRARLQKTACPRRRKYLKARGLDHGAADYRTWWKAFNGIRSWTG